MKKFSFRYQTVLEVRERQQKVEEEKLQRLVGEQRGLETELGRLRQDEAKVRADMLAAQSAASIDLQTLVLYGGFLDNMAKVLDAQIHAIEEAAARVENQREMLLAAMREAEVMRKLKERDEAAWREAIARAEDALIDELAMAKHVRKPPAIS